MYDEINPFRGAATNWIDFIVHWLSFGANDRDSREDAVRYVTPHSFLVRPHSIRISLDVGNPKGMG